MSAIEHDLQDLDRHGLKYFHKLSPLLPRLHPVGCARDRSGNRRLYRDHSVAWLLLYLFHPTCNSLRALQRLSQLEKVPKPSKALYEMVCWYWGGWASEEELMNAITAAQRRAKAPAR